MQSCCAGVRLTQARPNNMIAFIPVFTISTALFLSMCRGQGPSQVCWTACDPRTRVHWRGGQIGKRWAVTYLPRCQVSQIFVLAFNIIHRSRAVAKSKQTSKKKGKAWEKLRILCECGNRNTQWPIYIVGVNHNSFLPVDALSVFIARLNLDFGDETCFYDGLDAYSKTWLQFVFPLFIWVLVGLMILVSYYSQRFANLLGSNPVSVLATLILLSYTKILHTMITAVYFTHLEYPAYKRSVWLHDASVDYVAGKHIPLFLVAVLVFIFLFLPLFASHYPSMPCTHSSCVLHN